ncbi:MAG TPA: hypothetical protein VF463_15685 [Sphingobium sp.]
MSQMIPWDRLAVRDEICVGTLRDVALRWKNMESVDDEALLGVTVATGVQLAGWPEARTELWPEHISELSGYLDTQSATN